MRGTLAPHVRFSATREEYQTLYTNALPPPSSPELRPGRLVQCLAALLVGVLFASPGMAQEIVATPAHASGLYAVGEKISWRVELKDATGVTQVHYVVRKNGAKPIGEGDIDLAAGPGAVQTSLDEPGTVLVELTAKAAEKPIQTLVGAAANPEKIQPSAPRPADFDAFWNAKIAQLNAIPMNPVVEAADSGSPDVEYDKVKLDNINGTHVYGQLARPKREAKFPAMLIVQYAGVYGLPASNVVQPAKQGWLALDIMAHDLPFDRPEEFYKNAAATTLKDYVTIGNTDREKSYFLRMLLGCYRAADYLAQRPDWDGRTLVVTGTSQGGLQGLATAALYPKISAVMVCVPAGCDTTGPLVDRSVSWPYWYAAAKNSPDKDKIMETSRYFDGVNFASGIHCPALIALGLIDQTSAPTGVFSAFNQVQGPKEVVVMVNSAHQNRGRSQAPWWDASSLWLNRLVHGQPVPPP